MKILPEQEEFLQTNIRNAIALNPLVSIRKMQGIIERNTGRSVSDKYVAKLMAKIRRGAIIQSDRKQINERMTEVRERFRMLTEHLLLIIYWVPEYLNKYGVQYPSTKEKFAAIKLLGQMDLALFRAELDAGIFENKQAVLHEVLRQGIFPTELREQIIGASRTWKLKSENKEI